MMGHYCRGHVVIVLEDLGKPVLRSYGKRERKVVRVLVRIVDNNGKK